MRGRQIRQRILQQHCFENSRRRCRRKWLPRLVLVAIGVVTDSFNDDTWHLVPNTSSLHLESNNVSLFGDLITVLARLHRRVWSYARI